MSHVSIDDRSSRLKQFIWEELDRNFFIVVLFRSDRRYVVQRHFEQQLSIMQSSTTEMKWRRCLLEVISNSLSPLYITRSEVELMYEICSWHLNSPNHVLHLREHVDYMIDFEHLIDCSHSQILDEKNIQSFIMQPVTTLDAARKNIEMWKNLQKNSLEKIPNQSNEKSIKRKRPTTPILSSPEPSLLNVLSSSSGWLELDSKLVPYIKKHCDRLVPVEYLLKEHIISSSEDFSLRSSYIPIHDDDIQTFQALIRPAASTFNLRLSHHSFLLPLDHIIFRLKRLFFIRFLSSPLTSDHVDYRKIMSCNGGLLTLTNNQKQRVPFLYINKQKYIPQMNHIPLSSTSTFCMANRSELEFLRLIALYDYLSSDENNENLSKLAVMNELTLIPIDAYEEENFLTTILLTDFHYREYQRRSQQQRTLVNYEDKQPQQQQLSSGWWQPPISKPKGTSSHFKLQRPIFF